MYILLFVTALLQTAYHLKEQEKSFRLIYNSSVYFFLLDYLLGLNLIFHTFRKFQKYGLFKLALEILLIYLKKLFSNHPILWQLITH
jgi:hypothetical protein